VRDERGSVTVVTAGAMVVATVLAIGLADVTAALVARSHARMAADAAALAAAQEQALPSGLEPARVAALIATDNGAELIACSCARGSFEATATVRVELSGLRLLPGSHDLHATARAVVELPGS
jgi:secretion/DNA translocation related TadE-like protein